MNRWELVVVWATGEIDVFEYSTKEEAEGAGRGMRTALGNQIEWWGTRPAK